ncbi:MAG: WD40 repeat domain-containing protein [archaeon]|nr:WD40 repeat domain-containing protein [archaeon]
MSASVPPSTLPSRTTPDGFEIRWIGFNQDFSSFSVGTDTGFSIFDVDPLKPRLSRDPFLPSPGGIGIVEQLFRCNILALVGGGDNPKWPVNMVVLWDDHLGKKLGELEFHHPVRAVRLKRDRIFIQCESKLTVYSFQDLSVLRRIDTLPNPKGILAVSGTHPIFACPGVRAGDLYLNRGSSDSVHWPHTDSLPPPMERHKSKACEHALTCIALSQDGELVATGSETGTIVRVWRTSNLDNCLFEFRRGTESSAITQLVFNRDASLLLVTSEKPTIHMFSLTDRVTNTGSKLSLFGGYFGSVWSCAQFTSTSLAPRYVCFGADGHSVVVIAQDGSFWKQAFKIEDKTVIVSVTVEETCFLIPRPLSTNTIPDV